MAYGVEGGGSEVWSGGVLKFWGLFGQVMVFREWVLGVWILLSYLRWALHWLMDITSIQ